MTLNAGPRADVATRVGVGKGVEDVVANGTVANAVEKGKNKSPLALRLSAGHLGHRSWNPFAVDNP